MNTITLEELGNIIVEQKESFEGTGLNPDVFDDDNYRSVSFRFREFKKHNRLDCMVLLVIFPYYFKIYLDKNNYITKVPFNCESKKEKTLGKQLKLNGKKEYIYKRCALE